MRPTGAAPTMRPMTTNIETFQLSVEAAEIYETRFVPAVFAAWAPYLVEVADVRPGQVVLDVACGTGIVARTARPLVGSAGRVVGVDLNEAMLTVARRVAPGIEWRQGDVASLPFAAGSFDVVLCQMALMFFPDRPRALRELARVVAPGGTVAVCVPAALADQPAYGPLVEAAVRIAGPEAASLLGAYWVCGDLDRLTGELRAAGLEVSAALTRTNGARYPSADEAVATEVESTPLVERLTAEAYERLRAEGRAMLESYATPGGGVEVPLVGHLVAARRPVVD